MVCENCLAPASNVQGACCTCVLCNVGTLQPRLHDDLYSEIRWYAELLTAHTRPFVRPASCTVLRICFRNSGCDALFIHWKNASCFSWQVKKHFKPQMYDILLSVTYACWVNDFLFFMVLVTSFQIVSAQVYVLYPVFSQISHYVSREETERLSSTE